ncbi:MAG: sensor histidine kinase [Syntrophothermus sp.]
MVRSGVTLADLVRVADGWPLALLLAAALVGRALSSGRRRMALNEALHELRRPLQALVLAFPAEEHRAVDLSRQTAAALARLERRINGDPDPGRREPIALRPLLAAAVARWRAEAECRGGRLALGPVPPARVDGDRDSLERALDNLIVNAIEHGGGTASVGAEVEDRSVRIVVVDAGAAGDAHDAPGRLRAEGAAGLLAPLARRSGRGLRGHGLRIARRVAARHGGALVLRRRDAGTEAALELPRPAAGSRGRL